MVSLRDPFALLALVLVLSAAAPAQAVDESTRSMIREISSEGVALYQAGDYERARKKLDQAYSMLQTAPLGLWSARTLEKLGLLVEARERYLGAERAPIDPGGDRNPQLQARADAVEERRALEARIPKVVIHVQSDGAEEGEVTLTVAGKQLPAAFVDTAIPVNPGTIEIVVARRGMQASRKLQLDEGERKEVTLTLEPLPEGATPVESTDEKQSPEEDSTEGSAAADERRNPQSKKGSWQPVAGWIGVGLGVGGLVVGGVGSGLVYGKLDSLGCDGSGCPVGTDPDEMAAGNSLRVMSTVGYIAGGVLLATGVTLLITAPKKERQVAVRSMPGGGMLVVSGSF